VLKLINQLDQLIVITWHSTRCVLKNLWKKLKQE